MRYRNLDELKKHLGERAALLAARALELHALGPPDPTPGRAAAHTQGVMNETEHRYARRLDTFKLLGLVVACHFETEVLTLAEACTYRPDFVVLRSDGRKEYHEVKGAHVWDDATVKFKCASALFPGCRFVWARWDGKGRRWSFRVYEAGKRRRDIEKCDELLTE